MVRVAPICGGRPQPVGWRPVASGVGGGLCMLTTVLVLTTIWVPQAQGQSTESNDVAVQPPTEDVSPEQTLVLPVQGEKGIRGRYVKRLQKAIDRPIRGEAASPPPRQVPDEFEFPQDGSAPCGRDPQCLLKAGKSLKARRVVGSTVSSVGDDFKVTMTVVDVESERLVSHAPQDVKHNALAKAGKGLFSQTMGAAAAALPPPGPNEPKITDPGFSVDAVAKARGDLHPSVVSGEGGLSGKPLAAQLTVSDQAARRDPSKGPEGVSISVEDLAARMAEAEPPSGQGTSDGVSSGTMGQVVGEGLDELREGSSGTSQAAGRRSLTGPKDRKAAAARNAKRLTIVIAAVVGMFAFSVAFSVSYKLSGAKKDVRVSYLAQVGAKEAAQTAAILRECTRQLTPGILMSAELETSKRFCFALLDGQQLSVDVMQIKKEERAAFRNGMQLCAQFVHEGGTAMCMLTVVGSRKISPTRMRLQFQAPDRLARVTVPKGFQIPVGRQTPLLIKVVRDGETKQIWQARAQFASDDSLKLALDSDAFSFAAGDQVDVALRWEHDRADLLGEVADIDDGSVTLEVGDKHGGRAPREYKKMLLRLESQWLANLGRS